MQATSPYSQAALQRAHLLELDWPPMLPPSTPRLSPVPVHQSIEELHGFRQLASYQLQPAPPGMARSSALRGEATTTTTSSSSSSSSRAVPLEPMARRKRKAESQDPDEQVGMEILEAGTAGANPHPGGIKEEIRSIFENLNRALKPARNSWLEFRLCKILRDCSRLDQPNADLMHILALEAGGGNMRPDDLKVLLTQLVRLRYPFDKQDGDEIDPMRADLLRAAALEWQAYIGDSKAAPAFVPLGEGSAPRLRAYELVRAPLYERPILELCFGLGRALHSPHLHRLHAAVIEQVLEACGLPAERVDRMRDMLYLRTRSAAGRVPEPDLPSGKATVSSPDKASEARKSAEVALVLPPGSNLIDALIAERLELDQDPGWHDLQADGIGLSDGGLEAAIERWLAPARSAGPQGLQAAVSAGIGTLCRHGHRLGASASPAMRYLLQLAGGATLPAAQFAKWLRQIVGNYQDWAPDPHAPGSQGTPDANPMYELVRGLGLGVALSVIEPGGLPVLSVNKRVAAREILGARPGLDAGLRSSLASVLCLSTPVDPRPRAPATTLGTAAATRTQAG